MAAVKSVGAKTWLGVILLLSTLYGHATNAQPASVPARPTNHLSADPLASFIAEASKRFAIPEQWIRSVIRIESAGQVRARSSKGAMGLMQIMPPTWLELRDRYGLGADPYDRRDNILAGTAYIRELYQRYGSPGFLAAYNAGPARYENHLGTDRPLPEETKAYIAKLAPLTGDAPAGRNNVAVVETSTPARSSLFAAKMASSLFGVHRSEGSPGSGRPSVQILVDVSALVPQSAGLFVERVGAEDIVQASRFTIHKP